MESTKTLTARNKIRQHRKDYSLDDIDYIEFISEENKGYQLSQIFYNHIIREYFKITYSHLNHEIINELI